MKELNITNSNLKALVDDDTFENFSHYTYYAHKGVVHRIRKRTKPTTVPLSRDAMKDYDTMFDHKDRNYLNCQRYNLRKTDHRNNMRNFGKTKGSKSKYKGVSLGKSGWRAYIHVNTKQFHLGFFVTELEAAQAYNAKAKEVFGEFAVLNEI